MSTRAEDLEGVQTGRRDDVEYWRTLARAAGERLKIAETQTKDLRMAADEARARVTKYKQRLEGAQARVNELQTTLIEVSAQRDELRDMLATRQAVSAQALAQQEVIKRKVYEYRQSLLEGPIWEIFAEFCRDTNVGEQPAGDGNDQA